jgi:uncharacterized lipoprotein YddW (UPF0748 family)
MRLTRLFRVIFRLFQQLWSIYQHSLQTVFRKRPSFAAQFAIWGCLLLLATSATRAFAYEPTASVPFPPETATETTTQIARPNPASVPLPAPPPMEQPEEPVVTPAPAPAAQFLPKIGVNHQHEFRGAWVASVVNIDWPSRSDLSVSQQQAELINILDRMQELNLNALILQIRPNGDALYASEIEPWSGWLTGTQGKAPNPYYDPLEFAIAESHKRNIELHAWFNPYRAKMGGEKYPYGPNHMAAQYPQYAYQYGDLIWMDPGAKPVQDRVYNVIMDVVRRYDVDGIHLDDYFYPYPKEGIQFPDSQTYNAYRQAGGTLSLSDWRRQNVNQVIERIWKGIKTEKPSVKFGISPFGIYRPGKAPGIVGMDQYEAIYADVKLWLEKGWVDYLAPQLYWRIDPPQQSYPVLLQWWSDHNPFRRHIYAGNYLSKLDGSSWPISEFERQVEISRAGADKLSLGNIFFSMKVFKENRLGVNDRFRSQLYTTPALAPTMPWLDATPPQSPTGVSLNGRNLTWNRDSSNEVRSWTLYQQVGNNWQLKQIFNAQTTSANLAPGTYALCAADRLANESAGVVVSVR